MQPIVHYIPRKLMTTPTPPKPADKLPALNPNVPSIQNSTPALPATPGPVNRKFPKVPSFCRTIPEPKTENFQRSQTFTPTPAALPPALN